MGLNIQDLEESNIKTALENLLEQFALILINPSTIPRRIPVLLKLVKKCNRDMVDR